MSEMISIISIIAMVIIYLLTARYIKKDIDIRGKEKQINAFISRVLTDFNYNPSSEDPYKYKDSLGEDIGKTVHDYLNTYKVTTDYVWGVLDFIYSNPALMNAVKPKVSEWTKLRDFDEFMDLDIAVREHYNLKLHTELLQRKNK